MVLSRPQNFFLQHIEYAYEWSFTQVIGATAANIRQNGLTAKNMKIPKIIGKNMTDVT
jgi:hypothetical protein